MKIIKLSGGKTTMVCDCHYHLVKDNKWSLGNEYGQRKKVIDGKIVSFYIHRVINATPDGSDTDHINRDKLDNRCTNLRTSSRSVNIHNQPAKKDNALGVKGVRRHHNRYVAQITANGVHKYLGCHKTIEDAGNAYKQAALLIYGVQ